MAYGGDPDAAPLGDDKVARETGSLDNEAARQEEGAAAPLGDYDVETVERVYR